jgi:hypothetical protein
MCLVVTKEIHPHGHTSNDLSLRDVTSPPRQARMNEVGPGLEQNINRKEFEHQGEHTQNGVRRENKRCEGWCDGQVKNCPPQVSTS